MKLSRTVDSSSRTPTNQEIFAITQHKYYRPFYWAYSAEQWLQIDQRLECTIAGKIQTRVFHFHPVHLQALSI